MIKKNLTFVLFGFLSANVLADFEKIVQSDISEVEVFLAGAQITQNAKATVENGITNLIFENLSSKIDPNTLQANGKGNAIIVSVKHQLNYIKTQVKSQRIIQLEDSLDIMNLQLNKQRNKTDVLQKELELLMANKSIGGQNNGVSVTELQKIADFFRNRINEINDQLLDVQGKEKKIRDELAKINKQLADLQARQNQPTSEVIVSVSSKSNTNITLELKYLVRDAGWAPIYDLRASDTNGPIQFQYNAHVHQNSGVNWKDVKLTLSTGNPTINNTQPLLNPWYINFYAPPVHRSVAGKKEENMYSMEPAPAAKQDFSGVITEDISMETMADFIQVVEGAVNTEFIIELPYSIPSDGKPHLVSIQENQLTAEYSHFSVPKLDKDAFLLAKISGWDALNLLPGNANVFFEGSYVGQSFIDPNNTEDTLDISLGRDKKIVITREKKKDFSDDKVIGNIRVKTFVYEITVRNTQKDSVLLVIEDQIPLSQNKDIEVKLKDSSPGEYIETNGKIKWSINLGRSETIKKQFSFTVKYPKDSKISNLNF